ncbi:MAG: hypothetical protein HKO05_01290 [Erythrobacter sp.]|jgi:hypothetical protein|nr:hypothetical protein [Erythrobacter sp.]
MFEGNIQLHGPGESRQGGDLRAVTWPELVAKLAARRDLRGILMARGPSNRAASFNAGAAALLAGQLDGIPDVNRDALSDGKYPAPQQAGAAVSGATQGDRETR